MAYNFLPPFGLYSNEKDSGGDPILDTNNRLDDYIPNYGLTTGTIVPLEVDPLTGLATNLVGSTGPVGSTGGNSGDPRAATPFAMIQYGQTTQGIVQFVLMDADNIGFDNPGIYTFLPTTDLINANGTVQLYYNTYTIGFGPPIVVFYDANRIRQNPTVSVIEYQLVANTTSYDGNPNSYAIWPQKADCPSSSLSNLIDYTANISFLFNEFVNTTNPNDQTLKAGKLYHPDYIFLAGIDLPNEMVNYDYSGQINYGYPVNFNYQYYPITPLVPPTIGGPLDTISNPTPVDLTFPVKWPGPVSLSMYNFKNSSNPSNSISSISYILNMDPVNQEFTTIINTFSSGYGGFLHCSCPDNNECNNEYDPGFAEDGTTYYQNNCNTIQTGIAQFMIYQFIPIEQLKSPVGGVITDFTTPPNNIYSSATLPVDISFTPSILGATGVYYGSVPIQRQIMIDGSTGAVGYIMDGDFIQANPSILSAWMDAPTSDVFDCLREVTPGSYCGFTDYYDSLFGFTYEYAQCGNAGVCGINPLLEPFQSGACPGVNEICIPNFDYFNSYDILNTPPFICVDKSIGVTTENMNSYINYLPESSGLNNAQYPSYDPTDPPGTDLPNVKESTEQKIWYWIAIAIGVIFVIFIIYFFIRAFGRRRGPTLVPLFGN